MKMRRTALSTMPVFVGLVLAGLMVGSAQATIITVPDFSFTPDGSANAPTDITDIYTPNGNAAVLPAGSTSLAYVVTKFDFGISSDAHLRAQFLASGQQNRIGVEINDDGLVSTAGTGGSNRTTFNLSQDMAGQTVTLLIKLDYNVNYDTSLGLTPIGANDDTLMNVWVNPTVSSVEGSGISAGDLYALWNSAGFWWWKNTVFNQSTPPSAGASSIIDTVILTGADATFANALSAAGIPEPSTAILAGLGLMSVCFRRHRRG